MRSRYPLDPENWRCDSRWANKDYSAPFDSLCNDDIELVGSVGWRFERSSHAGLICEREQERPCKGRKIILKGFWKFENLIFFKTKKRKRGYYQTKRALDYLHILTGDSLSNKPKQPTSERSSSPNSYRAEQSPFQVCQSSVCKRISQPCQTPPLIIYKTP